MRAILKGNTAFLAILLTGAAFVAFYASLATGPVAINPIGILVSLFGNSSGVDAVIVQEIRLPRALLGAFVGATLGIAGAAMQGYVRNPLAEPGLIGVSASAALGAVLAIYFQLSTISPWVLPIGGMLGASVGVAVMMAIAGRSSSTLALILAGVAVSTLAGALTSLTLNLAPNPFAKLEIVFWLLGSLENRSFDHFWLSAPFMLVGILIMISLARALDALTLGEDTASTLGVNLRSVRLRLVLGVTIAVGAATAVTGTIGFVGLIVPHILRPFVGNQPSLLLPVSALGGALLVLLSDTAVRLLSFGSELKLGVFTALLGAPVFLWIVLRIRRQML